MKFCLLVLTVAASFVNVQPVRYHPPSSLPIGTSFQADDDASVEFQNPGMGEPTIVSAAAPTIEKRPKQKEVFGMSGEVFLMSDGLLPSSGVMSVANKLDLGVSIAAVLNLAEGEKVTIVQYTRILLDPKTAAQVIASAKDSTASAPRRRLLAVNETVMMYGLRVIFSAEILGAKGLLGTFKEALVLEENGKHLWRELASSGFTSADTGPFLRVSACEFRAKDGPPLTLNDIGKIVNTAGIKVEMDGLVFGRNATTRSEVSLPGKANASKYGGNAGNAGNASTFSDFVSAWKQRVASRAAKRIAKEELVPPGKLGPKQILVGDFGRCVDYDPQGHTLGSLWVNPSKIPTREGEYDNRKLGRHALNELDHTAPATTADLMASADVAKSVSANEPNGLASKIMVDQIHGRVSAETAKTYARMEKTQRKMIGSMSGGAVGSKPV